MLNNVVLVGRVKEINSENKTIKLLVENTEQSVLVTIAVNEKMIDTIDYYSGLESVIGVKGQVANDDNNQQIIKALKISLLTTKTTKEIIDNK